MLCDVVCCNDKFVSFRSGRTVCGIYFLTLIFQIVDNILIHNESVGMEIQTFKQTHIASADKHQDAEISGEEESTNPTFPALEDLDKETEPAISQEQSTLKSCLATEIHFPKNKRKRGERKAGSGGWSRQLPGEPDSQ